MKITFELRLAILEDLKAGWSGQDVAKKYGIANSSVSKIKADAFPRLKRRSVGELSKEIVAEQATSVPSVAEQYQSSAPPQPTEHKAKTLLDFVNFEDKTWITSHKFHEEIRPTNELKTTNRSIREAETYGELLNQGHIFEAEWDDSRIRGTELAPVIKSNSYNPVMLLDAVAQKALEHHFTKTAERAVDSSKLAAAFEELRDDPMLHTACAIIDLRKKQVQQEKEIQETNRQLLACNSELLRLAKETQNQNTKLSLVEQSVLEGSLTLEQSRIIVRICEQKARSYGNDKVNGYLKRDLKKHFGLNATNHTYKDIPRCKFSEAKEWAEKWVPPPSVTNNQPELF